MDELLDFVRRAFRIGAVHTQKKQLTEEELFGRLPVFPFQNGYKKLIWQAYKTGRFSRGK